MLTPAVIYFLQQGQTYSSKATPPNNVTLYGGHFLSNHTSMCVCVDLIDHLTRLFLSIYILCFCYLTHYVCCYKLCYKEAKIF